MNKKTPVVVGLGIIQQHGAYDELDEALILMEEATLSAESVASSIKINASSSSSYAPCCWIIPRPTTTGVFLFISSRN